MSTKKTTKPTPVAPKPKKEIPLVDQLITIKPGVEHFIGGRGIPDRIKDSGLYISRVNPNGTVVLASLDRMIDINGLYLKDVVLTGKSRLDTYHDTVKESLNVSVRIMGVPERMDCIKRNQKRLNIPDELIFIDENHEGLLQNAKRAWSYPTDKPYVMVLQDDVELCDDFISYVDAIVKAHPDSIISLFSVQYTRPCAFTRYPTETPYIKVNSITAQAIVMKTEYVEPCLAAWKDEYRGDDININKWATANDIEMLTTVPALVQHIGDESVFDRTRSMGRSEFYRKQPTEAHWEKTSVIHWENITN